MKNEIIKWEISEFGYPNTAGCYALCTMNIETKEEKLRYIGTSINLGRRLRGHSVLNILYEMFEYPVLVFVRFKEIDENKLRLQTESNLIKQFNPEYNILK